MALTRFIYSITRPFLMKERSHSPIPTNILILLALSENGSIKWGARLTRLGNISKKGGT